MVLGPSLFLEPNPASEPKPAQEPSSVLRPSPALGSRPAQEVSPALEPRPALGSGSALRLEPALKPRPVPERSPALEPTSVLEPRLVLELISVLRLRPAVEPSSAPEPSPAPGSSSALRPRPVLKPRPVPELSPALEFSAVSERGPVLKPNPAPEHRPAQESSSALEMSFAHRPLALNLELSPTPLPQPDLSPQTHHPEPRLWFPAKSVSLHLCPMIWYLEPRWTLAWPHCHRPLPLPRSQPFPPSHSWDLIGPPHPPHPSSLLLPPGWPSCSPSPRNPLLRGLASPPHSRSWELLRRGRRPSPSTVGCSLGLWPQWTASPLLPLPDQVPPEAAGDLAPPQAGGRRMERGFGFTGFGRL